MSSGRGVGSRGRGRGSGRVATQGTTARGAFGARGSGLFGNAASGVASLRGAFGLQVRGSALQKPRGLQNTNGFKQASHTGAFGAMQPKGNWQERYQSLEKARERERAEAIRQGFLADPDKPRNLADAITPVGTCPDMCAEFERVQRTVQKDVWAEERDPNQSSSSAYNHEPDERIMVKKFRRAAAGLEEQLPSDLRPPHVLKRTCDYLFHDLLGNAESLAKVHHFVWDRTRAIRNDFSIQQLTKMDDLSIAIECFERIVRFHIVSLHQLAVQPKPYDKYDAEQEREQLDRTLLSLMQYYDDNRGRLPLPNEAEFRAYCVIMQMQNPTPDLEDRVQNWPPEVLHNARMRTALVLYAAACNTLDEQGPLKPRAKQVTAQQDWQRFWRLIGSTGVSYLMACAAEIYFNMIRRTMLHALIRTTSPNPVSLKAWMLSEICDALALDSEDEAYNYCKQYGLSFVEKGGQQYLDLAPILQSRTLPQPNVGLQQQMKTMLVEDKRYGRTLPAIIDGFNVRRAREENMVSEMEEMGDEATMDDSQTVINGSGIVGTEPKDDGESLFMPQAGNRSAETESDVQQKINGAGVFGSPVASPIAVSSTTQATAPLQQDGFSFGKPTRFGRPTANGPSIFGSPATATANGDKPAGSTGKLGEPEKFTTSFAPSTTSMFTPPAAKSNRAASAFKFGVSGKSSPQQPSESASEAVPAMQRTEASSATSGLAAGSVLSQEPTAPTFERPTWPSSTSATTGQPESHETISTQQVTSAQWEEARPAASASPASSESMKSPFTFGQTGRSDPPTSTPSFLPQNEPPISSRPHFTKPQSPATNPPSKSSTPLSVPLTAALGPRKLSDQDNKPVKPSPLAHSFSADDQADARSEDLSSFDAPKQLGGELFPGKESQPHHSATAKTKPNKARKSEQPSFDSILSRLASELTLDPVAGFLKQYIQFVVDRTVNEIHDQLHTDRLNAEADKFRQEKIQQRYCKRWRELWWHQRLAQQGRERRRRKQQRLGFGKSQGLENNSLFSGDSLFGSSRAQSVLGAKFELGHSRGDMTDSKFQQSSHHDRTRNLTTSKQAKAGNKRPMSSHGVDTSSTPQQFGHKRMKSTSHVDDTGRIIKPTAASQGHADILKRSSFLGFSLPYGATHRASTTKSNYFKLKALGIKPDQKDGANGTQGRKRRRSETVDSATPIQTLLPQPEAGYQPSTTLVRQSSVGSTRSLKAKEEDEALLARVRAARDALHRSTLDMRLELASPDLRRSMSSRENESPSMARARADARVRASRAASPEHGVPAYRLRESKFVPREQYGRAMDRARKFRESRSRDISRPRSGIDTQPSIETAATSVEHENSANGAAQKPQQASPPHNELPDYMASTASQFAWSTQDTMQSPSAISDFTQNPHPGFTAQNEVNKKPPAAPYHAAKSAPFSAFGSQPTFSSGFGQPTFSTSQDHTVQPSQLGQSLFNTFKQCQSGGKAQTQSPSRNGFAPTAQPSFNTNPPVSAAQKTILLLPDDEDEAQAQQHNYPSYVNGFATANLLSDAQDEDEDEDVHASYGHANPYAPLAHHQCDESNGTQQWEEDTEEDEAGQSQGQYRNTYDRRFAQHSSYQQETYGENDEEGLLDDDSEEINGEDGDVEDEDGFDDDGAELGCNEDRGEFDDEEGEETEDATESEPEYFTMPGWPYRYPRGHKVQFINDTPQPPPNVAMAAVGNTQNEAIELSD